MPGVSLSLDTEDLAQRYDQISADRQFRGGQELLRDLALAPGETVLDIGCGTGMLAEYAASLVGSTGSVIGIDPLPLRIEIAKKRRAPNLSFKVGNAYDLGEVAAESFDVVYMNAVFHWLPEKSAPLRAILRALKPGGRLGITTVTPERAATWHLIRERVLARDPYNQYPAAQAIQSHRVSRDQLEQLLLENGFAITTLETRASARNASARGQWTPESIIEFAEASSFGNFLGHLPQELQAPAREDIKRELESLRTRRRPDDVTRENTARAGRIIAVATRP